MNQEQKNALANSELGNLPVELIESGKLKDLKQFRIKPEK